MKSFFSIKPERIPVREFLRPRSQLGVGGHDAQPLLVGEDGFANLVPALVEQVHVADLLDPLRRRVMRRVRSARHVIDEEWLLGGDRLDLLHVLDRLVGHRRGQVPARLPLEGVDGRRIAIEVRLPLAGVTADEPIEILEAHAVRPLVEGPGLGRLVERRVVILAEPRGRVPVVFQDGADGAVLLPDDGVVAWKSRRDFADHAEAGHVVIAPGDQRRARGRAERSGVEIRVAQPGLRDAIHCRGRNDAAEGARCAEAAIVGHDEQHVRRALRRHDARRPPGFRLRSLFLDLSAELRIGPRKLFTVERRRGAGRTQLTGDLLREPGCAMERKGDARNGDGDHPLGCVHVVVPFLGSSLAVAFDFAGAVRAVNGFTPRGGGAGAAKGHAAAAPFGGTLGAGVCAPTATASTSPPITVSTNNAVSANERAVEDFNRCEKVLERIATPGKKLELRGSRNHPALEHLVDDRCRNLVEERLAHLGILPEHLDRALLHLGFGLLCPCAFSRHSCSQLELWYF